MPSDEDLEASDAIPPDEPLASATGKGVECVQAPSLVDWPYDSTRQEEVEEEEDEFEDAMEEFEEQSSQALQDKGEISKAPRQEYLENLINAPRSNCLLYTSPSPRD